MKGKLFLRVGLLLFAAILLGSAATYAIAQPQLAGTEARAQVSSHLLWLLPIALVRLGRLLFREQVSRGQGIAVTIAPSPSTMAKTRSAAPRSDHTRAMEASRARAAGVSQGLQSEPLTSKLRIGDSPSSASTRAHETREAIHSPSAASPSNTDATAFSPTRLGEPSRWSASIDPSGVMMGPLSVPARASFQRRP